MHFRWYRLNFDVTNFGKKFFCHYWTSKANIMQLRAPLKRGEVCGGGRDRNKHENEDIEILFNFKQYLSALLTGDVRIVKFIRACLSSRLTLGFNCSALFRPHTTPTWVQQRVIFIFEDALVASFDHIPHWHIWPAKPSQVKKTAGHPLFIREIIFSQSGEAVWGKMWRTSEENVGHPGITQKIIFDAVRYVVEQHGMVLYGHPRKSSLTWYSM